MLISPKEPWYVAVSILLISIPTIPTVLIPMFLDNLASYIMFIVTSVFSILSIVLLVATAFKDPGFLERIDEQKEDDMSMSLTQLSAANGSKHITPVQTFLVNGNKVVVKKCTTCHIIRPQRSVHCRTCDYCVEVFDHHCHWLGSCVGRKNYALFFVSVSCLNLTCVVEICTNMVNSAFIIVEKKNKWMLLAPILASIYLFTAIVPIFSLLIYHIKIIRKGKTTYEYIKNIERVEHGGDFINNLHRIFCTKRVI